MVPAHHNAFAIFGCTQARVRVRTQGRGYWLCSPTWVMCHGTAGAVIAAAWR